MSWLGTERPFVTDDLDALDPLPVLLEVDALDEEETALHPLVGRLFLRTSGYLPRADQSIQSLEVGVRLGYLPVSLNVVGVVCHDGFSFFQVAFCGRYEGGLRPPVGRS
jgi:hypothetical protein